jgi:hypothetical protein
MIQEASMMKITILVFALILGSCASSRNASPDFISRACEGEDAILNKKASVKLEIYWNNHGPAATFEGCKDVFFDISITKSSTHPSELVNRFHELYDRIYMRYDQHIEVNAVIKIDRSGEFGAFRIIVLKIESVSLVGYGGVTVTRP